MGRDVRVHPSGSGLIETAQVKIAQSQESSGLRAGKHLVGRAPIRLMNPNIGLMASEHDGARGLLPDPPPLPQRLEAAMVLAVVADTARFFVGVVVLGWAIPASFCTQAIRGVER